MKRITMLLVAAVLSSPAYAGQAKEVSPKMPKPAKVGTKKPKAIIGPLDSQTAKPGSKKPKAIVGPASAGAKK